jgi:hypothetical protein
MGSSPGQHLNVAWGRRSGSALAYSAMEAARLPPTVTVIGHGNGFSGAICQSSAEGH